jgi:sec-independent protein translocase protein TatB
MFDISWSEFLLIGIVALVVIGPKELPGVLRTLGQYTRKVRRMATEFQNQFQEAMREAEMTDLKKEVDAMASDIKNYDPLKDVRSDVEAMGKDIESSLKAEPTPPKAEPPVDGGAAVSEGVPEVAAPEAAAPVMAVEHSPLEPAAAEPAAKAEPAAETQPAPADNTTERPA